jgi:tRNA-specific 2-thiouridylase
MSGGVDSSIAAALLQEQGCSVAGFTMSLASLGLEPGDVFAAGVDCARRVAGELGIPHHVVDVSDAFRNEVIEPFVHAYAAGRTPNPCVRCNRMLKFRMLLECADALGMELVATGHYARVARDSNGGAHLHVATDVARDQSYFLYNLTRQQLQRVRFPLGGMTKDAVRELARTLGIHVADRDDSQEICFIPDKDYAAYVRRHFPETLKPGAIRDISGQEVGSHEGIQFYTIGQRKGIGAHGARKFVVRIESESGDVIIGDNADLMATGLTVENVNWIAPPADPEFPAAAKIRSAMEAAPCTVYAGESPVRVVFDTAQRAITPGQACVLYVGDEVLGGGLISCQGSALSAQ